jgi:integrase
MLAKRPLTERTIASLKPDGKRRIVWDYVPNFGLRVTENGAKTFVFVKRFPGSPHPSTRAIGQYGAISLEDARAVAQEWHKAIRQGVDPAAAKQETFGAICEEYMAREGSKLRSARNRQANLDRLILPTFGARPIGEIKRSEIIRLLDRIEDERGREMAHKALAVMGKIMNWHAARSDTFRSPIVRGMGRSANASRQRILSDDELRAVWHASDQPFGRMVRFILLTAARRNEAAELRLEEVDGLVWTLPAARNKVGVELVRPLTEAAMAQLGEGEWAFSVSGRRPLASFTRLKAEHDRQSGVSGYVIHDLRRTSRSLMSRAGVSADVAERVLGHVIGGVRGVYDRHSFYQEKKIALEKLASLIDQLVNPRENVVPLAAVTRT